MNVTKGHEFFLDYANVQHPKLFNHGGSNARVWKSFLIFRFDFRDDVHHLRSFIYEVWFCGLNDLITFFPHRKWRSEGLGGKRCRELDVVF